MKARIKELANVKAGEDIYKNAREIVFDLERGLQVYNNADIANKYIKNALKIEWIVDGNLDFLNARIFIHNNLVINTESNSVLTEQNLESELYSKQHSIFTCEGRDSLSLFYFDMTVKLDNRAKKVGIKQAFISESWKDKNSGEYDRRSSIMWQAAKAEYLSKQKR